MTIYLITFGLLLMAFAIYTAGNALSSVLVIALGAAFEVAFWVWLFAGRAEEKA